MDSGYCEPCWAFVAIAALVGAVAIIAMLLLGPTPPDAFHGSLKTPDSARVDREPPHVVAAAP